MKNLIRKILHEEVKNGKVICDNCEWTWKLSEGGHDPYICHQCNHNNEPKKINEDYKSNYWGFKENIFNALKHIWDKKGLNFKEFNRLQEFLGVDNITPYLIEYYGGLDGVLKIVEEKIYNKKFTCKDCAYGDLNFKYKVTSIEVPNSTEYTGQVDIAVSASENGWGSLYDEDGNEKKFSSFSRVVDDSDSRFYNYLHDTVRENIEEQINEVFLAGTGLAVRVDYLDFVPERFI
jgi:hypothetical protein